MECSCFKHRKKGKVLHQTSITSYLTRDINKKKSIQHDFPELYSELLQPCTPDKSVNNTINTRKVVETPSYQSNSPNEIPNILSDTQYEISNKRVDKTQSVEKRKKDKNSVDSAGPSENEVERSLFQDILSAIEKDINPILNDLKDKYGQSSPKNYAQVDNYSYISDKNNKENFIQRTRREPNEIRAASLVCPILYRIFPKESLRRTLNSMGIYRNYLEDSGFHVVLADIGEELIRKQFATEGCPSDNLSSVCMYCGFRSESRLVLGNHFDVKHKNAFRKWPYSRRIY